MWRDYKSALTVNVPVLDRLWCGRCSQFGHQDSHDVEEENEINLWKNQTQRETLHSVLNISERLFSGEVSLLKQTKEDACQSQRLNTFYFIII